MNTLLCWTLLFAAANPASQTTASDPVEKAARQFRIRVYNAFHADRPTYDLLRAAGDQVLDEWHRAGRPEAAEARVIQWFQQASRVSPASTLPPLPDLTPYQTSRSAASPAVVETGEGRTSCPQAGPPPTEQFVAATHGDSFASPETDLSQPRPKTSRTPVVLRAVGSALWRSVSRPFVGWAHAASD